MTGDDWFESIFNPLTWLLIILPTLAILFEYWSSIPFKAGFFFLILAIACFPLEKFFFKTDRKFLSTLTTFAGFAFLITASVYFVPVILPRIEHFRDEYLGIKTSYEQDQLFIGIILVLWFVGLPIGVTIGDIIHEKKLPPEIMAESRTAIRAAAPTWFASGLFAVIVSGLLLFTKYGHFSDLVYAGLGFAVWLAFRETTNVQKAPNFRFHSSKTINRPEAEYQVTYTIAYYHPKKKKLTHEDQQLIEHRLNDVAQSTIHLVQFPCPSLTLQPHVAKALEEVAPEHGIERVIFTIVSNTTKPNQQQPPGIYVGEPS